MALLVDLRREIYGNTTHHAEVVLNPNLMNQKMVTDFGYPRACRFRKTLNENRSSTNFFQT
jgi:hypothetical protein